jgi:hypothetical protein
LVANRGYAAFAEDVSGRYLTSVRAGKAAAGCTNSASKSPDKLNPLSFMTLLAARRQMAWDGLDLPPGWNVLTAAEDDLNCLGFWIGAGASPPRTAPPHPEMTGARGRPRTTGHRAASHQARALPPHPFPAPVPHHATPAAALDVCAGLAELP